MDASGSSVCTIDQKHCLIPFAACFNMQLSWDGFLYPTFLLSHMGGGKKSILIQSLALTVCYVTCCVLHTVGITWVVHACVDTDTYRKHYTQDKARIAKTNRKGVVIPCYIVYFCTKPMFTSTLKKKKQILLRTFKLLKSIVNRHQSSPPELRWGSNYIM